MIDANSFSPGGTPRQSQSVSSIGERLNTRHMLAYRRTFNNEDQDIWETLNTMPGSIIVAYHKTTLSLLVGAPLPHTAAAPELNFTEFAPTGAPHVTMRIAPLNTPKYPKDLWALRYGIRVMPWPDWHFYHNNPLVNPCKIMTFMRICILYHDLLTAFSKNVIHHLLPMTQSKSNISFCKIFS